MNEEPSLRDLLPEDRREEFDLLLDSIHDNAYSAGHDARVAGRAKSPAGVAILVAHYQEQIASLRWAGEINQRRKRNARDIASKAIRELRDARKDNEVLSYELEAVRRDLEMARSFRRDLEEANKIIDRLVRNRDELIAERDTLRDRLSVRGLEVSREGVRPTFAQDNQGTVILPPGKTPDN